jgi:lysine-N-methylase
VDKKTFLKYRDVADKELNEALDKAVKRYRGKTASDTQYASFRLMRGEDDLKCAFLDKEGLCSIHKKLGYGHLCDVCAVYPRYYRIVDGKLERCATMSCPEAVRTALDNPDGIAFETVQLDTKTDRVPPRIPSVDTRQTRLAAKPAKFLWEVRTFCLTLLQNREYTLGQRLILIGILCHKIDELDKAGGAEGIPALLEDFSDEIDSGSLRPSLDAVETNFQIQLKLAKELTDEKLATELIAGHTYIECVKETLAGLNCFTDTAPDDILKKYLENRET